MARKTRPNAAREKVIRARQDPPGWGADYIPGQLANKEEAPDESRPATVYSKELGRAVHCMSVPEKNAFLLGTYVGLFRELHEGRMLAPEPAPGPLSGYPWGEGAAVVGHIGTIQIAEKLGVMKWHPTVSVPESSGSKKRKIIAFPLLGDLLWYLHDEQGPYCVNWTIKQSPEDFHRPHGARRNSTIESAEQEEAQQARLAIEIELYREVDVPTIAVANTDIPAHVSLNLRQFYVWQDRTANFEEEQQTEIVGTLQARIPRGVPVFETLRSLMARHGGAFYDYQVVLYQAIWRRHLPIDLWIPFNIDQPIHPEQRNVVKHFAQWFKRGGV